MPGSVLLPDCELVIPNLLCKPEASTPVNTCATDDSPHEQNDQAVMTEEQLHASDGVQLAPQAKFLMSPTQALTTQFDIDVDNEKSINSDPAARLASDEIRQGFHVGELRFMVRYENASELAEVPQTHRVPNAPDWFCGLANLQGKLIPVFDLAMYFDVAPDPQAKRMLLVLLRGRDATGVLIDGLPERLRYSKTEYTDVSVAPERLAPLLHGTNSIQEQLWFDLNPHALLDAMEQSLTVPQ